jgi:hypothetical protein
MFLGSLAPPIHGSKPPLAPPTKAPGGEQTESEGKPSGRIRVAPHEFIRRVRPGYRALLQPLVSQFEAVKARSNLLLVKVTESGSGCLGELIRALHDQHQIIHQFLER